MPQDQIGPVFLATPSLVFGVYGIRELALACRPWPLDHWVERVMPGAAGVTLGALFACCPHGPIETATGIERAVAWSLH